MLRKSARGKQVARPPHLHHRARCRGGAKALRKLRHELPHQQRALASHQLACRPERHFFAAARSEVKERKHDGAAAGSAD